MKFSIIGTGFIFPSHVQAIKSVGGEIVEAIGERSLLFSLAFIILTLFYIYFGLLKKFKQVF